MNANLTDAELMVAMDDPTPALTAPVGRSSPASAVCHLDLSEAQELRHALDPAAAQAQPHDAGPDGPPVRPGEESDSTPRSEVPSAMDAATAETLQLQTSSSSSSAAAAAAEPGYFSPRPLRVYQSRMSTSKPSSTDPSPTASLNPSTASVNIAELPSAHDPPHAALLEAFERPAVQRDISSTSTSSAVTVRAHSVDPVGTFSTPSKHHRDGPHYPNQSYAALQNQHYPPLHYPHFPRTRSSHPANHSAHSVAYASAFGILPDHHREIMESGSRTVGNSPASSPGLFNPTTPPLRQGQSDPTDDGHYASPYLHHTHRQAPKETHVADVDVDPISGRKIINQYEVIDELGRGVHGKVKLGRNLETGVHVAIKIVDRYSKRRRLGKNTSHEDKIKKEIAILKKARHPHIVSLLEVIDDPTRKKVYIVLEHVELGEVKWRTKAEKEIALIEWRRHQRESQGIFDNECAKLEDESILSHAHDKIDRQLRRRAKVLHMRRDEVDENGPWSLEHGGETEDDGSESGHSRASAHPGERPPSRQQASSRSEGDVPHESNMETAYRSTTPVASCRQEEQSIATGLEGTMYGAYDTEPIRGRTPSLAGSSSSRFTDEDDEVPEHFHHVPLMTLQAARETFRDTVLGLEYLHYQNVVHRDIKPANLLQTKEHRIKISDFGVSYLGRPPTREPTGDQSESDIDADEAVELAKTVGTPAFYAPELCRTDLDAEPLPVTNKIDIWALGVTLYCLIFGRVPFHDHNTFHLMKLISESDVYIPKFRLKAVAEQPGSRPNSHGRIYQPMTTSKRAPHDLEYDEIDDTLRDLLERLLIKDPRERISLKEIKSHPWLLQGLDNFTSWVEETDPGRTSHGRRIEVSKEDVDKAVVPITLIDRVRSGVRKTLDTVLGMGRRGGSRRRAQSTTQDQQQSISAHSSSSTISQEGRRPSLGLNQSIFEALSRSREAEHPLSQSVTASPEATERLKYLESTDLRTASPAHSAEGIEYVAPLIGSPRPLPPERAHSTTSSAASVRTLRPSDLSRSGMPVSPGLPPALPGTPTALDALGGSNLGGIFGGVPRRFVNSVRSRERMLRLPLEHNRAKSIDRLVGADDDPHAGPSIAISTASAAGHVDQPDLLKELSPILGRGPSPSPFDVNSPDPNERTSSRQSSISSASSYLNRAYAAHHQLDFGPTPDLVPYNRPVLPREASEDRFNRAKDELVRQRVREGNQSRERPRSMNIARPASAISESRCPPSPDDEVYFQRQRVVADYLNRGHSPPLEPSSVSFPAQTRALTSSSSEDHFTSMSQSTSNPSIPSVVSATTSVATDDCLQMSSMSAIAPTASADSFNQFHALVDDPAGYDGDDALESDQDDGDDEDDFIMMGKKKPAKRSGSISNAELARSTIRKDIIAERRRSERSGSNGTVKKIPPAGESDRADHG